MDLYDRVSSSISRLQNLPERQRHSIFFVILTFAVLVSGIFSIVNTKNSIAKIGQDLQTANLFGAQKEALNEDTIVEDSSGFQENTIQNKESYYNVEYSYVVEYPSEWQVNVLSPEEIYISSKPLEDQAFASSPHILIKTTQLGLDASLDQQVTNITKDLTDLFSLSKVKMDKEDGYLIKFICQQNDCGPSQRFTIKNNNLYSIDTNLESDLSVSQIISSFKFTY